VTGQSVANAPSDVLAEDRLLWQFWVNKGMRPEPLAARLEQLPEDPNWDYLSGNALYGGFEGELLGALASPGMTGRTPAGFLDRLRRDVAGSREPVTPSTPEGRLLVLCASPRMTGAEEQEATGLAAGPIGWEASVQAAARANITIAVHHNLSRLGLTGRMPPELAGVLEARARGVTARNRRLLSLLEEITSMLCEKGIRPLLLKESALALTHYGNGRLRMMGDIDLLFSGGDLDSVVERLEADGYESAEVLWTKDHYRRRHHHAAPLVHEDLAAKIEPHHSIALPVTAPPGLIDGMAQRAVRMDARSWCFTPADTLFHLCADLLGGAFYGKLGQACDAREVIRQGGVEWGRLERTAAEAGAEAHIAFSLNLLADLDAPVPLEVLRRLESARRPAFDARRLRRMARRNMFGYVRSRAWMTRPAEKLVFAAMMRPGGWLSRLGFLLRRYLQVDAPDEEIGELARAARPTAWRAFGRLLSAPLRAVRRWTTSRRMP